MPVWFAVSILALAATAPSEATLRARLGKAFDAHDKVEIVAAAKALTAAFPQSAEDWYFGGYAANVADHAFAEEALGRALKLGLARRDRRALAHVLRADAELELGGSKDFAQSEVEAGLREDPDAVGVAFFASDVYMRLGLYQHALDQARKAVAQRPGWPVGHLSEAYALRALGETEQAEQEAQRARALGASEQTLADFERFSAAGDGGPSWVIWSLAGAGGFVGALLLLMLAGLALSRRTARRIAAPGQEGVLDRLAIRVYRALLFLGALLFYAALPLSILLTLVYGAVVTVLLYAVFGAGLHSGLLIVFSLSATVIGVAVIATSLIRDYERAAGRRLDPGEAPELFALLAGAAAAARAKVIDRVELIAEPSIGVREEGRPIAVLLGRGRRVLQLGLTAIDGLEVGELEAILCHELGHFSHGETRLTPFISSIRVALVEIQTALQSLGIWAALNPAYWLLAGFRSVFERLASGHSQRCELLADRAAAERCGGEVFSRALVHVVEHGDFFARFAGPAAVHALELGRVPADLCGGIALALERLPEPLRAARRAELLERPPDAHDSHPPPKLRMAQVEGVRAERPEDTRPVSALFPGFEALKEELTSQWFGALRTRLERDGGIFPSASAITPELAAPWMAALLGYERATAEAGADSAEALEAALQGLGEVIGPMDHANVVLLQRAAKAHLASGRANAAISTMERAVLIAESQPESDQRTAQLLESRSLLEQIRAAAAA